MPLSPSEFQQISSRAAVDVLLDNYRSIDMVHPRIMTRVTDPTVKPFGHKESTLQGSGSPVRRRPGQQIAEVTDGEGFTVRMAIKRYAKKLAIPDELVESMDAAGIGNYVRQNTANWGRSFATMKEELAAGLFNKGRLNAGDATYFDQTWPGEADPNPKVIYDGESFFGDAHVNKAGTTYSNVLDSTALSATAFDSAMTLLTSTNAKDEKDNKIDMPATHLLVPPALRATAMKILKSELQPGTAQNDANPYFGAVEPIVWRYLTSSTPWFLGSAGPQAGSRGVIYYDEGEPDFRTWYDENRRSWMVSSEIAVGYAVADFRAWVNGNGSAS